MCIRDRRRDDVDVSVLDGLVVDLQRSTTKELSFNREDIIMPLDMGPLKKGMRLALASGTARIIKLSEDDRSISLMGPLGGIHNLDVLADSDDDLFPLLNAGDVVNFRLIQPVAVQIKKAPIAKVQANPMAKSREVLEVQVLARTPRDHVESRAKAKLANNLNLSLIHI